MTIAPVDGSQRKAAKAAGWAYLVTFAIVVYVNFGILGRLIAADSAAETARNIAAHEQFFRLGIVGDLIYCMGVVLLLTALYVILRPVSLGLALLAALWRLVFVLMWLASALRIFDALRLLRGADYLRTLEAGQLQSLARFYLSSGLDYYYVGLLFGASASTVCGYLWLKSRYMPQSLAVFGVVSSAWCAVCTVLFCIFPGFEKVVNAWWFDMPMVIFDIATSFWLLFGGLSPPGAASNSAPAM